MNPVTALLPMKGESERVPDKNVRPFLGQPLCRRVLGTLQACAGVDRIIVNTDSARIAALTSAFSKAVVHERPAHLCGHHISMNDIIAWDLAQDAASGQDVYLQTHATNPLLTPDTMGRAIAAYFENLPAHDSLFSVTPFQTRLYTADGHGVNHDPKRLVNTQDLPVLYEENSNIFLFSRESFRKAGNLRIGLSPAMFPMNKLEAVDIDTEEDFLLAEALASLQLHLRQG